jgi:hypothetical protein
MAGHFTIQVTTWAAANWQRPQQTTATTAQALGEFGEPAILPSPNVHDKSVILHKKWRK